MSAAELAEFLRARLDEDERAARAAFPAPWIRHDKVAGVHADDSTPERTYGTAVADCRRVRDGYGVPNADHIARWDPTRVLAEVNAKRRIIDPYTVALEKREGVREQIRAILHTDPEAFGALHRQESQLIEDAAALAPVVRLLALPYADHPDYREEWRL